MAVNKRKILAAAQKHLQRGALDKALGAYQTLVGADPRDANSRLKLGDIQLRLGNREEAIEAYVKVAEQFMHDGFDAKAVAIYKQIAKIDAQQIAIYEPLAELYQRLGLTSEALGALQTAADAHHREGRKREALELLRKMATLDPTNTTSRLKIADLLCQADMPAEALAEYEEVAEELTRQGAREDLPRVYERILEIEPQRLSALGGLARSLVEQGQCARAEPFAKRLVEANPNDAEAYELLGEVYTQLKRDDALGEVYRALAELYRTRGDEEKARAITQRFMAGELSFGGDSQDSGDGQFSGGGEFELADGAPQAEMPEEVAPSIELTAEDELADEAGDDPEQLLAEASVYLRYGKTERAVEVLESILATEPDHRAALEKLGEAFATAENKERAVEAWSHAAKVASAAGDEAGFELLCERIAALDAAAMLKLTATRRKPEEVDLPAEPESQGEPETIDDLDLEIATDDPSDLPDPVSDEAAGGPAEEEVAAPADADDDDDLEIEVDFSEVNADAAPEGSGEVAPAADPLAPAEDSGDDSEDGTLGTATTPEQVATDIEEADFYFNQGLGDEAEAIYRRVIQAVPNHPHALLRLGEIAQARGEDPAAASADSAAIQPDLETRPLDVASGDEIDLDIEPEADEALADPEGADEVAGDEPPSPQEEEPSSAEPPPAPEEGFDLAAELSGVFEEGEGEQADEGGQHDGFDAVFREFKKGVQATLSEGDYEAHYDLGIAYREMGLLDDAMAEFRTASAAPERKLACLHMIGLCALDLAQPGDAVTHLQQALALPEVPEQQQAVLRFDLGRAFEAAGDRDAAGDAYRAVIEVDPDFQDVAERLAALDRPDAEGDDDESYENFSDLVAEAEAELSGGDDAIEAQDDGSGVDEEEEVAVAVEAEAEIAEAEEAPEEPQPSGGGKKRRRKISFL